MMTSGEIRRQFLEFFRERGHEIVDSSPVVPLDDPTLMFANAGMNQFKDVFLGTGSRSYVRAANTQKCIRAGGKHNDLDDVGRDTYHQTFFEMLGNWSFGDYFKKEAIHWAWELLTGVWGIEKDRLHATYFEGDAAEGLEPDEESAKLWRSVTDIRPDHIHPGGKKDNFWEMGDTGPCGPCSEIHVDLTPDKSGGSLVNAGDPNVIELWNLVFIQFNRAGDGKLTPLPAKHVDTGLGLERLCAVLNGKSSNYDTDVFQPLFAAISERTKAPGYKGTLPGDEKRDGGTKGRRDEGGVSLEQVMIDVSYRVIADHLRCLTFALTDGAIPSNEGRGYVLRSILRRAMFHGGQFLKMTESFLCDVVAPLVDNLADVFPELRTAHGGNNVDYVIDLIREEEEGFLRNLDRGTPFAWQAVVRAIQLRADEEGVKFHGPLPKPTVGARGSVTEQTASRATLDDEFDLNGTLISYDTVTRSDWSKHLDRTPTIAGSYAFRLHDTYGFPIGLTVLMAEQRGIAVDLPEYERLMEKAREKARGTVVYGGDAESVSTWGGKFPPTDDTPKYADESTTANIVAILRFASDSSAHMLDLGSALHAGDNALVFVDRTSFYCEQGGQVGDTGEITRPGSRFEVQEVLRLGTSIAHRGRLAHGALSLDEQVHVTVCSVRRITMQNHTATHILNWALREVLGERVEQKGSLVDPEKTRFDFSHNKPLTRDELGRIESLVTEQIEAGYTVYTQEVDQEAARKIDTLRAVFGEKYPDRVRVVSVGADIDEMLSDPKNPEWMKYSVEFCGGTHLGNSSEAERFALISEEAVAKGVRRVVGISGEAAMHARAHGLALWGCVNALFDEPPDEIAARIGDVQASVNEAVIPVCRAMELREKLAELQQIVRQHGKEQASAAAGDVMTVAAKLLDESEVLGGVNVIVGEVPQAGADALRNAVDWFRQKTKSSAVLLACHDGKKVTMIAGMSRDVVAKGVKAGDLIKQVAPAVGGKGGGRPDMAQGGGTNPGGIPTALENAKLWLAERLT